MPPAPAPGAPVAPGPEGAPGVPGVGAGAVPAPGAVEVPGADGAVGAGPGLVVPDVEDWDDPEAAGAVDCANTGYAMIGSTAQALRARIFFMWFS